MHKEERIQISLTFFLNQFSDVSQIKVKRHVPGKGGTGGARGRDPGFEGRTKLCN